MTLDQHLDWCADRWPDRPFLIANGEISTYSDVVARSKELAMTLHRAGVGPATHVGFLMASSPEFFAYTFAAARLGATVIALNYLLAAPELEFILRQSGCEVVVADRT